MDIGSWLDVIGVHRVEKSEVNTFIMREKNIHKKSVAAVPSRSVLDKPITSQRVIPLDTQLWSLKSCKVTLKLVQNFR